MYLFTYVFIYNQSFFYRIYSRLFRPRGSIYKPAAKIKKKIRKNQKSKKNAYGHTKCDGIRADFNGYSRNFNPEPTILRAISGGKSFCPSMATTSARLTLSASNSDFERARSLGVLMAKSCSIVFLAM